MAQNRTDNFSINAPKPIDNRYLNGNVVYSSVEEAHSLINYKHLGLTVLVNKSGVPTEYWYQTSTSSVVDLVEKKPVTSTPPSSAAKTVSELRALSSTTGSTYVSTDGGTWIDLGLNDGVYTDDGAIYIITANGHALKREFSEAISVKWFGANGNGITDDAVPVQKAADYIVANGGHLYFPKGRYLINSSYITFAGGSNIKVTGDGIGATIIERSITGHYTAKPGERNQEVGIFKVDSVVNGDFVENFVFEGLTFKRDNYVAPWTSGENENRHQHNFFFGKVKQIVFEKCEFDGSSSEMLYWNGSVSDTASNITIHACVFRNGQMNEPQFGYSSMVNSNTVASKNIRVTENTFINSGAGVLLLGENIVVSDNIFKDVVTAPIEVAETNFTTNISVKGAIVSGNNISGLGKGVTTVANIAAIRVKSLSALSVSLDYDDAVMISNNNIFETYMHVGHQMAGISAEGSCKIVNNYISKVLLKDGNTSNSAIAINTLSVTGGGGSDRKIYIENNVIEKNELPGSLDAGWFIGINMTNTDTTGGVKNTTYFLSDNKINAPLTIYMQPVVGSQPVAKVYCNSNYSKGAVVLRGTWGVNGISEEGIYDGNNYGPLIINNKIYNISTGEYQEPLFVKGDKTIEGQTTFAKSLTVNTNGAPSEINLVGSPFGDNGINIENWKIGVNVGGAGDGTFNLFDKTQFTSALTVQPNHDVIFEKRVSALAATTDTQLTTLAQVKARTEVSVKDFGALGNGIADDLPAFNAAIAFCSTSGKTLMIPKGVYRVTGRILIGHRFINESEYFYSNIISAPSYSQPEFDLAVRTRMFSIIGEGNESIIYGDFVPTDTLGAIIYYGANQFPHVTNGGHGSKISNIQIAGAGRYTSGTYQYPTSFPTGNKQIGIFMAQVNGIELEAIYYSGLSKGIVASNCYWSNFSRFRFESCDVGFETLTHNATTNNNFVAYNCNTAYLVNGQGFKMTNLTTEQCKVDIWFKGCDNVQLDTTYFENIDPTHTDYGIKLGTLVSEETANYGKTVHCKFVNCHQTRAGGKAILINENANKIYFDTVRTYGSEIHGFGAASEALFVNSDQETVLTGSAKIYTHDSTGRFNNLVVEGSTSFGGGLNVTGLDAGGIVNFSSGFAIPDNQLINYANGWGLYKSGISFFIRDQYNSRQFAQFIPGGNSVDSQAIFNARVSASPAVDAGDVVTLGQIGTALTITSPDATDDASAWLLLNEIKAKLNAL